MKTNRGISTFSLHERGIAHLFLLVIVIFVAIGAIGYLAYQNAQLQKRVGESTQTPESTEQQGEVLESPETANWETYSNSKYGFTFKYPSDFLITQMDSIKPSAALSSYVVAPEKHKDFLGPQIPMLTLTIYNNSETSLLDWFGVHATRKKFDDPSVSMKDSPFYYREYSDPQPTTFDGNEGISFSSLTMNGEVNHVLLITPDQNYILDWSSNENFRVEYNKTFNQILSTFKFLDESDETADWETYTHSVAGFSFKYPSNLSPSKCKDGLHLFETSLNLTSAEYCESPPYGKVSIDFGPGFSPGLLPPDYEVESSKTVVNGVPANKSIHRQVVSGPGPNYVQFIGLSGDKYAYLLTLRDENFEPVFNQILSTFKFTK